MEMLGTLILYCCDNLRVPLVKADLIRELVITLNPQFISLSDCEHIHINVLRIISLSVWLATPNGFTQLGIKDRNEQQAIHKTISQSVVAPVEKYISHLCVNRYSIVDGEQSQCFLDLLAQLLQISPYYQPTMDIVLNMPQYWDKERGKVRNMGKNVNGMLRMEGIEDVIEEKLRNDETKFGGVENNVTAINVRLKLPPNIVHLRPFEHGLCLLSPLALPHPLEPFLHPCRLQHHKLLPLHHFIPISSLPPSLTQPHKPHTRLFLLPHRHRFKQPPHSFHHSLSTQLVHSPLTPPTLPNS
ncbi:hypothetical protein BLNAU_3313 [Blattamonas nauphoetae]|uniref:Uncharacterized protein n=1 Tax=Blattamonas nauphoetae TaxID=2049346 RepID=A0ABQ9YDM8_9EUKA|nr:hypothetical protein BLNAU_3313 [Blattamonas nauphoetae]